MSETDILCIWTACHTAVLDAFDEAPEDGIEVDRASYGEVAASGLRDRRGRGHSSESEEDGRRETHYE